MPITPLSGSGGIDEEWGDKSGGVIQFAFTHPTYTSLHEFRVLPFDTAGTALYTGSPAGVVTGVQQEADNLATLIAALYAADTTIAALALSQTLSSQNGQAPYAFTFAGTSTVAGSAGGSSLPVFNVENFTSRGADGSRWHVTLPGVSSAVSSGTGGIQRWPTIGAGAVQNLVNYLTGVSNGPTHAAKTGVVTHNGVAIQKGPGTITNAMNKRLRRHFKVV